MDVNGKRYSKDKGKEWASLPTKDECKEKCMTEEPLATACEYDRISKNCIAHTYAFGRQAGEDLSLCSPITPNGLLIIDIIATLTFKI